MKVENKQLAWLMVEKKFPHLVKDYDASTRAGYPIFQDFSNPTNYVCDLNTRIEINEGYQTQTIWIERPLSIKDYAGLESKAITTRTWVGGTSKDIVRRATKTESEILAGLIEAGLTSIESGKDEATVLYTLEMACMKLLPNANAYNSVYCKIKQCPKELLNEKEKRYVQQYA